MLTPSTLAATLTHRCTPQATLLARLVARLLPYATEELQTGVECLYVSGSFASGEMERLQSAEAIELEEMIHALRASTLQAMQSRVFRPVHLPRFTMGSTARSWVYARSYGPLVNRHTDGPPDGLCTNYVRRAKSGRAKCSRRSRTLRRQTLSCFQHIRTLHPP